MPGTETTMPVAAHRATVGRDEPPPEPIELRAGPVTAWLYEGDLRHVRLGGVELVQRVYMAVRDEVWNTIPGTIEDLDVRASGDGFVVTFACRHTYEEIDFAWRARISGAPDGTIAYEVDGRALTAFRYAKIGLNVHHPLAGSVGRPYRAHRDGEERRGRLPVDIEPQLFLDGTLTALFPEYESLVIELGGGREVRFDFEGDLFEMQDHRNWTDANLKTYGTPLALPWPFDAEPGREIRQTARISFSGPAPAPAPRPRAVGVRVGGDSGLALPPIGLGLAREGGAPSEQEAELLATTRPAHVRADVVVDDPGLEDELARAVATARALAAPLELAVFTGDADAADARRVAAALATHDVALARVLVFAGGQGFSSTSGTTTPAAVVRAVRESLGDRVAGVPVAGGTDQFFTEINRNRPDADGMDAVVYSINPQVHAADDLSLMENLEAQGDTVRMARKLAGGRPVFVSPVTLIGRYGPFPAGPPRAGDLPGNIDVRHAALFGAAWTVGSIRRLAEAGTAAITFYETTGPRGLVHRDTGLPRDAFPVRPGEAMPVLHVFADIAGEGPARLLSAGSDDPAAVEALAIARGDTATVLVANLTPREQRVELAFEEPREATVRVLDASVAAAAMRDPAGFRAHAGEGHSGERLELRLAAYAVARIVAPATGSQRGRSEET
jgi:D-apionolactonase